MTAPQRAAARGVRRRCALAAGLALWLAANSAGADDAVRRPDRNPAPPIAPPLLGETSQALHARFGEALLVQDVASPVSSYEEILEGGKPEVSGVPDASASGTGPQVRLARASPGDVRRVEYDLFRDRVYRIRWQLAPRFERPLMDDLVRRLGKSLGPPAYDQTLRAKLGSGRADLRRAGWSLDARALEVRQLHPFLGGPIFLSIADRAALQSIVDAEQAPLPQPDRSEPWWRRPQRPPSLLTTAEREELLAAADALVAKLAGTPGPGAGD